MDQQVLTLARRLCSQLRIDTIEELEMAAHDGRLEAVPGVDPRRAGMMRGALADMLSRVRPAGRRRQAEPEVAILVDVDREYREKSGAGRLAKIAP